MRKKVLVLLFFVLFLSTTKGLLAEEVKKVLILPFEIYAQQDLSFLKKALPEMLTSRLSTPEKIQVIEGNVEEELKAYSLVDQKVAMELGKKFGADFVIWGSITVLGDMVSIDAQIMDIHNVKKPAKFFQEIKGISEVIPQLTRFARKSKRYIEGKEEDFYQEDLAIAPGYSNLAMGRAHPERGYFGYPLYPVRPPKEEPVVEKAKPRFGGIGDPAYEGLTKDVVIDLSGGQARIGMAREEKGNATKAAPNSPPPYMYYYPPQPYYNYSPPPYYYYQQKAEEEGILSKIKNTLWPFGREKERPIPAQPVQPIPVQPTPIPPSPTPQQNTLPQKDTQGETAKPKQLEAQPKSASQRELPTRSTTYESATQSSGAKPNPWRWE
ncbi:MAG: hypothetical protein ACK40E_03225 [Caldimicrobium sp.]